MRGKPSDSWLRCSSPRITPAHAGKTSFIISTRSVLTDHPRACGENSIRSTQKNSRNGSPPRMRGKLAGLSAALTKSRITPAHAGKTTGLSEKALSVSDHPRACGENASLSFPPLFVYGSPPRMRGKPGDGGMLSGQWRITPAHAGKTFLLRFLLYTHTDHPRACGENSCTASSIAAFSGSPPRMRGKHFGNGVFPWLILVLSLNPL
nr:MAG TPA: hypothetical protein [Caudoviricetes sp.]